MMSEPQSTITESPLLVDPPNLEPTPPTDLIFDDGEPLESKRHYIAIGVLIRSLVQAYGDRNDYFAGGNMFIYFSNKRIFNRDFRGPDFFVTLDTDGSRERQGWVVWEEDGRYPDVIVEFLSPTTEAIDRSVKKDLYQRTFKTRNYFIFDPFKSDSLEGWQLDLNRGYQPLTPNDHGWLWSDALGLWLGPWEGSLDREPPTGTCHWLRFYDPDGNLVSLPEEAAQQQAELARQQAQQMQQQAEATQQRAERLAEQLRQLGIDPETL